MKAEKRKRSQRGFMEEGRGMMKVKNGRSQVRAFEN